MRRITAAVGLLTIIALVSAAASSAASAATIVATHAVFGEFAEILAGDDLDVVTIIPSGFCPAQYDLSPRDLAAVLDASLILYSGFEVWIEQLAAASDAELLQLPGIWNTPDAAIEKVGSIRGALAARFPDLADAFSERAATYTDRLHELGTQLLDRAAAVSSVDFSVVCMKWQAEFVGWLGFDVAVSYAPPASLTLQDLVRLTESGTAAGAELVIDNLQSGVQFGGKLARELDAIHVVLSNFPGAMPNSATVIDLLERNAEALFDAVSPWDEGES